MKGIRIPLHGFVELTPLEIALVDSEPMRRLRRIKQLAMCDEVYPGATHTRFEHSIGVLSVASRMFDSIFKEDKKNKEFLEDLGYKTNDRAYWKKAIRLAALLHDVGHAPFSHAGEGLLPTNNKTSKPYKHEDYTVAIIKEFLADILEDGDLNTNCPFSEDTVNADYLCKFFNDSPDKNVALWRPLISSQLDADRADYLLRDSYHLGINYGHYDLARIIETLTLTNVGNSVVIAIDKSGRQAVEGLLVARYMMFLQVYFHHSRRAFDHHLTGALKELLPEGCYPSPETKSELESYLEWDDARVYELLKAGCSDNKDAEAIISRRHDSCFFGTNPTPKDSGDTVREIEKGIKLAENVSDICKPRKDEVDDQEWYKYIGKERDLNNPEGSFKIRNSIFISDEARETSNLKDVSPIINGLHSSTFRRWYVSREYAEQVKAKLKGTQ
jgi:hypothetical protein